MSEAVSASALWGRIALFNKLITQRQWDECVEVYRKGGGKTSIDKILVHKGYIQDKHAEVIRKKVNEVISKRGSAPASASKPESSSSSSKPSSRHHATSSRNTPGSAGTSGRPENGGAHASATAAKSDPGAPGRAPKAEAHPAAAAQAAAQPAEAEGSAIALASDVPGAEGEAGWRPSDAEWVEAEGAGTAKPTTVSRHSDDMDPIPLAGDEDLSVATAPEAAEAPAAAAPAGAAKSKSKIVIHEYEPLKAVTNATPKFAYQPTKAPAPAHAKPAAGEAAPEESAERIESPVAPLDIDPEALEILRKGVQIGASDVHLSAGSPPFFRLHGQLVFTELPKLTPERATRIVLGFMDDAQQQRFLKHHDLDFSFEDPGVTRFRVNALEQFRGADIIFRIIASKIPTLEELGLPATLAKFTEWHQGLVLITGPAGSGKSTTAAAMLGMINSSRQDHIITFEDPVEVIHVSKGCNVTQRQVPRDTLTFSTGLRGALREDPDVIMIGEMRDLETVSLAIRAAETGHLVFATLQTRNAARTIDRVIDVFPSDQQAQIRTMLSESLRGVISQQLIPRADGKGRIVAVEVLHCNSAAANLIRDSKTFQLGSLMQTGRKSGQKLMDESLMELLEAGIITREAALKACENVKYFNKKEEPEEGGKGGKKKSNGQD